MAQSFIDHISPISLVINEQSMTSKSLRKSKIGYTKSLIEIEDMKVTGFTPWQQI